jgi:hypothetical protein
MRRRPRFFTRIGLWIIALAAMALVGQLIAARASAAPLPRAPELHRLTAVHGAGQASLWRDLLPRTPSPRARR